MTENELKARTKEFAKRVLRLVETLPHTRTGNIIANQLGRSGTSVGANYRAACRARSRADFVSKLGVVEEEADESAYWLELISEEEIVPPHKMQALLGEASELTAIMVSSRKTIGTGRPRSKIGN